MPQYMYGDWLPEDIYPEVDEEPEDDGEPDFSLPTAQLGTYDEWDHPFADVDAEIDNE